MLKQKMILVKINLSFVDDDFSQNLTHPPLKGWCWSELLGVWCSNTLLSGAVSEAALICALWNLTSSSTFSRCFFDMRPNLTAGKKNRMIHPNFSKMSILKSLITY